MGQVNWTGANKKKLRQVLLSVYPNPTKLAKFLSDEFDRNLNAITSNDNLENRAYELIESAQAEGWLDELYEKFIAENSTNPSIQKFRPELESNLLISRNHTIAIEQRMAIDRPLVQGVEDFPFVVPTAIEQLELESFLPRPLSYEADVGLLQRGLQRASAVCKVSFVNGSQTGTGVAIAPDLVLTNYHVVSRRDLGDRSALEALAQEARLEFGFVGGEEDSPPVSKVFAVDGTQAVLASSPPAELDYVLLRVERAMAAASEIVPIAFESPAIPSPRSGLNLLQHPAGERMQVSLSASGVLQSDEQRGRIWYVNPTQGGSSGSPCFNGNWEMVALHHASIARWFGSVREGILCRAIFGEIDRFLQ